MNKRLFFIFTSLLLNEVCHKEVQTTGQSASDDDSGDPETVDIQQCQKSSCSYADKEPDMALVPYNEDSIPMLYKPKRQFTFLGHTINIAQDWGKLGVAAVVWDAAVVLCEYVTQHPETVQGRRVLELGAGTGLVGMVVALAGGEVTITERAEVLEHLQTAVSSNLSPSEHHYHISELDWTHDHSHQNSNYDVILGADIIYIEDTFPDLLRTLLHFMKPGTEVLLSCKIRYERDSKFLSMLQEHADISKIYFDVQRDIHIYSAKRTANKTS